MQKSEVEKINTEGKEEESFQRMEVCFGKEKEEHNHRKVKNSVRTSKYTWITWAPLSLLYQFTRAANIYFLWISILTCMPFSPKAPASMIGTFSGVLIFTMFKELFEDYYRMKSDKQINNTKTHIYNYDKKDFEQVTWKDVKQGDIIKVQKDESFPADILFLHSKTDVIFVDTMNLDGETNLKPKVLASREMVDIIKNDEDSKGNDESELPKFDLSKIHELKGNIECEFPNENLEQWDANLNLDHGDKKPTNLKINNILLRGCLLRNTEFVLGVVVYMGKETKIMKNAKKAPRKVSNLMKMMNYMLYTVFIFQLLIISIFATISVIWISEAGKKYDYLDMTDKSVGIGTWFIQLLTYWVAYSHMIPISLYVIIEVLKLVQSYLVKWDDQMYDKETDQFAECRNSDLVEELGQIDFIFSDKTGTLTCNKMIFKRCSVDGKVFSTDEEDQDTPDFEEEKEVSGFAHNDKDSTEMMLHGFGRPKNNDKIIESCKGNPSLHEFFKFMALWHSVMVDHDPKTNEISYQASSPDELALVNASKDVGIELKERTKDFVEIVENGIKKEYKILAEFPFNSDRKRMSVIIENDNKFFLYCKGADSIMTKRIKWKMNQEQTVFDHLEKFAIEGLRTLVMAKREMTASEYAKFEEKQAYLETSNFRNKDERLFDLYSEYERDLIYVGASAIEDKLQKNVPQTIAKLMSANIRLWVLTGDKQETAIEIAKSCLLIQEGMDVKILTQAVDSSVDPSEIIDVLTSKIDTYKDEFNWNPEDAKNGYKNVESNDSLSIVIDGPTLDLVLGNKKLEEHFFSFALYARSVVWCRVSPKQKALVVKLAKYKKGSISLSIGDGANDVPMIMEANVGVGIRGLEGTQAVRASDYAISQFEFLKRLILIHGRLGYRRVAWVICYYFYKNILLVFTEIYFAFYCGFSGQIYFADWLPMLYNSMWTSATCLFAFSLERDVLNKSLIVPKLYRMGQERRYFSYKIFWKWVILSIYHGFIVFHGSNFGFKDAVAENGRTEDLWFSSTTAFSCIIHLVTIKLVIELIFLNWIVILAGAVSLAFYWLFVIVFNTHAFSSVFQPELDNVYFRMFANFQFWLALIFVPMIALVPDATIKYFQMLYSPTESDTVVKQRHYLRNNEDTDSEQLGLNKTNKSTKKSKVG